MPGVAMSLPCHWTSEKIGLTAVVWSLPRNEVFASLRTARQDLSLRLRGLQETTVFPV